MANTRHVRAVNALDPVIVAALPVPDVHVREVENTRARLDRVASAPDPVIVAAHRVAIVVPARMVLQVVAAEVVVVAVEMANALDPVSVARNRIALVRHVRVVNAAPHPRHP